MLEAFDNASLFVPGQYRFVGSGAVHPFTGMVQGRLTTLSIDSDLGIAYRDFGTRRLQGRCQLMAEANLLIRTLQRTADQTDPRRHRVDAIPLTKIPLKTL
ncbi:hypothetical protein D3C77_154630 [compost metagenome]